MVFDLNTIMKEKSITSRELAELTGILKRTIDEYRGARKKETSYANDLKIAKALGCDPYELVNFDDET